MSEDPYRGGIISKSVNKLVLDYISSISYDEKIKNYVIDIIKAHAIVLHEIGVISFNSLKALIKELLEIENIKLNEESEDIHAEIESILMKKLGAEIAGNINIAKSRNDQVATAIRMCLREELIAIMKNLIDLNEEIIRKAKENIETIMPGYTHLQQAQVTTLAHYLLAHHDRLNRDLQRLFELIKRINVSPMGAGALATSSFPIDRKKESEILGFDGLIENSIDAVSSRDFIYETIFNFASIMTNLSSIAEEIILWTTSEFGFAILPDELVSTSSAMPQKRNPVAAEIVRARTSNVYGDLVSAFTILKALPLGYSLDLQEITPHLWNSSKIVNESIKVMKEMIKGLTINKERLEEDVKRGFPFAIELANVLVRHGIPFRVAHMTIGKYLREKGEFDEESFISYVRELHRIELTKKEVEDATDPKKVIESYSNIGGPSRKVLEKAIELRENEIKKNKNEIENIERRIMNYKNKLRRIVDDILTRSSE